MRKKKLTGQQMLIYLLIKRYGGPSKVIAKLNKRVKNPLKKQNCVHWKDRGGVPLKYVYILAEIFDVSPYALNYSGLSKMINKEMSWAKVVATCKCLCSGGR